MVKQEQYITKKDLDKLIKATKKKKKERSQIISRRLIKKQPRATYVIGASPDYQRSSFYNETYEREKKLLGWN